MTEFMIAFHGGRPFSTPEEGMEYGKKWQAWLDDLGDAVVNPGTPVGQSKFVTSDGVSDSGDSVPLFGWSIVKAADLDAACKIAQACPHLMIGSLEVAEVKQMGGGKK